MMADEPVKGVCSAKICGRRNDPENPGANRGDAEIRLADVG